MRRKLRKSDIFDELKEKKQSPVIPIIIFLAIVTILFISAYWIYNIVTKKTDIKLPWNNNTTTKEEKKQQSSKSQMDLVVPELPKDVNTLLFNNSELVFTAISADKNGYLITASLTCIKEEYITIEVNSMSIDGFHISTKFAISDRLDYNNENRPLREQEPTEVIFRINKTELDDLGIFGFNQIKMYFDLESENTKQKNSRMHIVAKNHLNIVNERKGLIQIDKKEDITISYFKTLDTEDATFIYFDFKNTNKSRDFTVKIKNLEINGKLYDLKDFKGKIYRDSEDDLYLKIPKSDISKVSTLNVSFYILGQSSEGNVDYIYITNDYIKTY